MVHLRKRASRLAVSSWSRLGAWTKRLRSQASFQAPVSVPLKFGRSGLLKACRKSKLSGRCETEMPRRYRRGILFDGPYGRLAKLLAGSFIRPNFVPRRITVRETAAVVLGKVTKAGILVVIRTFETKALRLLTIVFTGFEATLVALLHSFVAVIEDVTAIAGAIRRPRIVTKRIVSEVPVVPPVTETPWTVDAIGVRTNDDHSSPAALCLRIRRRSKRNAKKHEQTENDATNPSHVLSFH